MLTARARGSTGRKELMPVLTLNHKQRTCPPWTLLDLDALELFVASSTACFLHLIQRLHDAVEGAEEFQ